ncbi:hypothetical protein FHX62_004665 [Cupriavidus alkaliphilus]|nr:hypothetical protein [Cupriavidus alkaliphilus]SCB29358.1 Transposase, Mutator family [Cupriavidus alkaliphilus]
MPRRTKTSQAADRELPTIPEDLSAHFVKGPMTAEAVQDASMAFKKALIERALGAELGHHLRYAAGAERPAGTVNQRNGKSAKTLLTDDGPLRVDMPRDRDGSFDPILIPKHERRFTGFDDKIIARYARGMTVREMRPPSKTGARSMHPVQATTDQAGTLGRAVATWPCITALALAAASMAATVLAADVVPDGGTRMMFWLQTDIDIPLAAPFAGVTLLNQYGLDWSAFRNQSQRSKDAK